MVPDMHVLAASAILQSGISYQDVPCQCGQPVKGVVKQAKNDPGEHSHCPNQHLYMIRPVPAFLDLCQGSKGMQAGADKGSNANNRFHMTPRIIS